MTDEYMQRALALKNQKLFETETVYQSCLDKYQCIFQKNFRSICENIVTLQGSGKLGEISYLEYTMLYTSLAQRKWNSQVRVYGVDWYFDSRQMGAGNFDIPFLLTKYQELWNALMTERKRYAGAVSAQDALSFLLASAPQFYKYVAAACRFSILPCIEEGPFRLMQRAERFEINVGEYMARTESIYKENKGITSKNALDWFMQRHEFEYTFECFCGLDFSGADLSKIDLRYSDLRNAKLAGTDFQGSMLFGTRFCNADMQGANLRCCLIHEADFTGANLSNACFTSAKAYSGLPKRPDWITTGYRKVSFRNADLTETDFRECGIQDADFTGAVMDGALFQKEQIMQFALSQEQKQAVRLQ